MMRPIVDRDLLIKVCKERAVNPVLLRAMVAVERNVMTKKDRSEELKRLLENAAQEEFSK
jgi:hypothetical protein